MILAAYSCPERIFTHLRTTENAPLWNNKKKERKFNIYQHFMLYIRFIRQFYPLWKRKSHRRLFSGITSCLETQNIIDWLASEKLAFHIIRGMELNYRFCFRFFYKFYRLDSCSSFHLLSTSFRKPLLHVFLKFSEELHWLHVAPGIKYKPLIIELHHFIYISWFRTSHQLGSLASEFREEHRGALRLETPLLRNSTDFLLQQESNITLSSLYLQVWTPHQLRSLTSVVFPGVFFSEEKSQCFSVLVLQWWNRLQLPVFLPQSSKNLNPGEHLFTLPQNLFGKYIGSFGLWGFLQNSPNKSKLNWKLLFHITPYTVLLNKQ